MSNSNFNLFEDLKIFGLKLLCFIKFKIVFVRLVSDTVSGESFSSGPDSSATHVNIKLSDLNPNLMYSHADRDPKETHTSSTRSTSAAQNE